MSANQTNQSDNQGDTLPDDAELFRQLQTGQNNALVSLYDRHAALVYGIALRLLGNRQEAEDLTQDIFLSLTKKCSYDPQRGSLRTYLGILTRSRGMDRLRSRHRSQVRYQKQARIESSDMATDNSLEVIAQTERAQKVQLALNQLSVREQEVLRMAYYEGLSQSEIAARLNLALGTVKSRSRSGLLKLRRALSNM